MVPIFYGQQLLTIHPKAISIFCTLLVRKESLMSQER